MAILFLSVLLVLLTLIFVHSDIPQKPDQPHCWIRGWPPRMLLLTALPISDDNITKNVTYQGHYCHPSLKTLFCGRPPNSYKRLCTLNQMDKSVPAKCNMTDIIWKMYPDLIDVSKHPTVKGSKLCMVISATNKYGTSYSKSKCCNVRTSVHCTGISNLQVTALEKGELIIQWNAPSYIDENMRKTLKYEIRYTGNYKRKIIEYNVFTARRPTNLHKITIKNLSPYTLYSVEVSCYFLSPSGKFTWPLFVRTLPEAPSIPPKITSVKTNSLNSTMKTVQLEWEHPPENKRNGMILKSVVEYWRTEALSNSTLSYHKINLTIKGNSTKALLKGLDINSDYIVTVRSCTSAVECSEQSKQYTIQGQSNGPLPTPLRSTGSPHNTVTVVVLVFAVIFVVSIIAFIIFKFMYKRQCERRCRIPRVSLPNDIQISEETNSEAERPFENESSDYAQPASLLTSLEANTSVEANHDRASMLQNDVDGYDVENKTTSMEEIPLC